MDLRNQIEGEHHLQRSITTLYKAAVLAIVESTYSALMILTKPDWAAIRSRGAYPVLKFSLLPVGRVIKSKISDMGLLGRMTGSKRTRHRGQRTYHTGSKSDDLRTKGPATLSSQQGARTLFQLIETAALSPKGSLYIWPVRSALV